MALNCAALPESLLESELFGIEGGVATGVQARRGKFELAHQAARCSSTRSATWTRHLQVKLLRALQEREIVRVGGEKAIGDRCAAGRRRPTRVARGSRSAKGPLPRGPVLPAQGCRDRDARRCGSGARTFLTWCGYFTEKFCQREHDSRYHSSPSEALALLHRRTSIRATCVSCRIWSRVPSRWPTRYGRSRADCLLDAELSRADEGVATPEALDLEAAERRHISPCSGRSRVATRVQRAARILGDRSTYTVNVRGF